MDANTQLNDSSVKLPKLACFKGKLMLDGYGAEIISTPGRRDSHPFFGTWPYNIGDQFVALSCAKVMQFDEFYYINPTAPQADFDIINQECDVFVIRGSNWIYPGFFKQFMPLELLKKIKIPIFYFGAGIQVLLGEDIDLLPEDVEALRYIHDSTTSCGVRGYRAAELLEKYGITNVRVTGCPTIISSLQPTLTVKKPSWDRVAWTITDMYSRSKDQNDHIEQLQVMDMIRSKAKDFYIMVQGGEVVLQEYIFHRDQVIFDTREETQVSSNVTRSLIKRKDLATLEKTARWYYRHASPALVDSFINKSFFSNSVKDYLDFTASLSLVIGTRLHGNIMGLSRGVPAVFAYHDERVRDMATFMKVPNFNLFGVNSIKDLNLDELDWTPFEKQYREIYKGFKNLFEENNIAHSLSEQPQAVAALK